MAKEAPLTPDDVKTIVATCSPRGVLVGGQALAFWADHLAVERPAALVPTVTADADFIGDATLARALGDRLGWETWVPSIDDATVQTGKVTHRVSGGRTKQVDFLSGVVGLTTKDVLRRAAELMVPGVGLVRVMHPIDVLDSRIQNLHLLPEKRNAIGVAQAELAVDMTRAFIDRQVQELGEKPSLKLLERVAEIATDIAAVRVFLRFGIDPLLAVPIESFRSMPKLRSDRWPQIQREASKKRTLARKAMERGKAAVTTRRNAGPKA
jgi:hypothetical protein